MAFPINTNPFAISTHRNHSQSVTHSAKTEEEFIPLPTIIEVDESPDALQQNEEVGGALVRSPGMCDIRDIFKKA